MSGKAFIHKSLSPDNPLSQVLRLNVSQPLLQHCVPHLIGYFHHLVNEHVLVLMLHSPLRERVHSNVVHFYFIPEELKNFHTMPLKLQVS